MSTFSDLMGAAASRVARPPGQAGASVGSAPAVPQGVNPRDPAGGAAASPVPPQPIASTGGNLSTGKTKQDAKSKGGDINIGGAGPISGTVLVVIALLLILGIFFFLVLR